MRRVFDSFHKARPSREDDGIGHQDDELRSRQPAHAAESHSRRSRRAARRPSLQVFSEPSLRWSDACLNFHDFDIQSWLP